MGRKFSEMVSELLPVDLPLSGLQELAPRQLWEKNDYLATAYALRKHSSINWQAYMERYPDVKASGMDACLHFLRYGVYEQRKLVSFHPLRQKHTKSDVLVSIIIITCNNEGYLERCLRSVREQTLKNIEIIIVDDCSTDRTQNIILGFAKIDPRIKLVLNKNNEGIFIAKKKAVALSTGNYIIFLDPNSHMLPTACEIAHTHIIKGYDAVTFCIDSYNNRKLCLENNEYRQFFNLNDIELQSTDLSECISKNVNMDNLCSTIIISAIVKEAFSSLHFKTIVLIEDLVIFVAMLKFIRSILKINDKLCYSNSSSCDSELNSMISNDEFFTIPVSSRLLETYINDERIDLDFKRLKEHFCTITLSRLFAKVKASDIKQYWDIIVESFGFDFTLEILIKHYWNNFSPVAKNLHGICSQTQTHERLGNIGIKCAAIDEISSTISVVSLAAYLQSIGINVLVLALDDSNSHKLPAGTRVIPQLAPGDTAETRMAYAQTLMTDIKLNNISCIINYDADHPASICDISICAHFKIPHIAVLQNDIFWLISHLHYDYNHHFYINLYKCYSSVITNTKISELYYHLQNINARIFSPIVLHNKYLTNEHHNHRNIIYVGDFRNSESNPCEAFSVLVEILKSVPETHLYIIGEFNNEQEYKNLLSEALRLELAKYISITPSIDGWLTILQQCHIFISTAFWNGSQTFIAQALAFGLPCIIYNIPLDDDIDCEAIIRVQQGNSFHMAMEVLDLYEDDRRLKALAEVGKRKVSKFTKENCEKELNQFFDAFLRSCPYTPYSIGDYKKLMKYIVWYNQHRRF